MKHVNIQDISSFIEGILFLIFVLVIIITIAFFTNNLNTIANIKTISSILVDATIITLFFLGLPILKYKVNEQSIKLYMDNYDKVQKILDKNFKFPEFSLDDINRLEIEEQNATVYLDGETVKLINTIKNIATELHSFYIPDNNEKNAKKLQFLLSKWGYYKAYLSEYYRERIVLEPFKWLYFPKDK